MIDPNNNEMQNFIEQFDVLLETQANIKHADTLKQAKIDLASI